MPNKADKINAVGSAIREDKGLFEVVCGLTMPEF